MSKNITPAMELAILAEAADKLGPNSYCGAWLREQLPFIEQDIRADMLPGIRSMNLRDHVAAVAQAAKDAKVIIEEARLDAARIREDARLDAYSIRDGILTQLASALRTLSIKASEGKI